MNNAQLIADNLQDALLELDSTLNFMRKARDKMLAEEYEPELKAAEVEDLIGAVKVLRSSLVQRYYEWDTYARNREDEN